MKVLLRYKGGPGSGNKGHAGIPGHQGGSQAKGGVNAGAIQDWEEDLMFVKSIRDADYAGKGDAEYKDFMESVDNLPDFTGTLYRGMNEVDLGRLQILDKYSKGNVIKVDAISSFSKSIGTASYFSARGLDYENAEIVDLPSNTAVVMKILEGKGKDLIDVASIPEHKEVLVRKGARIRIQSSMPVSMKIEGQIRKFLLVTGIMYE